MAADFDRLLGEFLVDLNGDGKITQDEIAAQRQPRIPDYGLGPVTARTQAGRSNTFMVPAELPTAAEAAGNALLRYGPMPAQSVVQQITETAPRALSQATDDPSLANLTNAGVQSVLALGRVAPALGILGAGYAAAGAKDIGLSLVDSANAKVVANKSAQAQTIPDLPGLTPEQNSEYKASVSAVKSGGFSTGAERRYHEGVIERYGKMSAKFAEDAGDARQGEYNRAVIASEEAYAREMARNRRFSDTETGRLFEKTGGLTPVLAGFGAGMASRAATGPGQTFVGKAFKDYVMPAASGALTGATVANAPVYYDAYQTEADNPQKRAYEARARELPQGHPRKQEFLDFAASLPDQNPIRQQAQQEFTDGLIGRMGAGAIEGAGGGLLGAEAVRIPGRLADWFKGPVGGGGGPPTGGGPGNGGAPGGQPPPIPPQGPVPPPGGLPPGGPPQWGPFRTYGQLPQSAKDNAAEAYLIERLLQGQALPEKAIANGMRGPLNAPVTPARIRETNAIVEAFVAQNGRPPTKSEFNALRTAATLGLAGSIPAGNALIDLYGGAQP